MKRQSEAISMKEFDKVDEYIKQNSFSGIYVFYTGGGDAKIIGNVTGTTYIFKEGIPQLVDNRDVEAMLAMRRNQGCCGSTNKQKPIFEKIDFDPETGEIFT